MFELLEAYDGQGQFERGDVITGTVALVSDHEILIDVGAKSEGVLASREFSEMSRDERSSIEEGQDVECMVVNTEDRSGHLVLSLAQAKQGQDWDAAQEKFEADEAFEETITGHNKGGLIVHIGAVRGFCPISQIDRRHAVDRSLIDGSPNSPLADMVGREIMVKVIEIDRRKNRLILSEQAAMREQRAQRKEALLVELHEGEVVEGTVTSLADFGAFVDIGGADGLVHLSELAWQRVSHPREKVSLGDQVTVKVISVDRDRKRIGLSLKQLEPEPWSDLENRFEVGSVVEGEITRLADFGAFARVDGEVEGLIHISELSDDELPPADVVSPGEKVDVRIIRIDADKKRLGLSLKRAGEEYDEIREESAAAVSAASEDGAGQAEAAEQPARENEAEPEEQPAGENGAAADTEKQPARENDAEPQAEDDPTGEGAPDGEPTAETQDAEPIGDATPEEEPADEAGAPAHEAVAAMEEEQHG